jgi:hypothetical protein
MILINLFIQYSQMYTGQKEWVGAVLIMATYRPPDVTLPNNELVEGPLLLDACVFDAPFELPWRLFSDTGTG